MFEPVLQSLLLVAALDLALLGCSSATDVIHQQPALGMLAVLYQFDLFAPCVSY